MTRLEFEEVLRELSLWLAVKCQCSRKQAYSELKLKLKTDRKYKEDYEELRIFAHPKTSTF